MNKWMIWGVFNHPYFLVQHPCFQWGKPCWAARPCCACSSSKVHPTCWKATWLARGAVDFKPLERVAGGGGVFLLLLLLLLLVVVVFLLLVCFCCCCCGCVEGRIGWMIVFKRHVCCIFTCFQRKSW